jgi:hypothetical protein
LPKKKEFFMWGRSPEPAGILLTFKTHPWTDLLRWKQTRTGLVERLRQAKDCHKASILNYVVLPDCVAVLTLPASCEAACKLAGRLRAIVATDYLRRTGREGPFWKGKLQCTLVLGKAALQRCLEEMTVAPVRRELVLQTG